MPNQPVDANVVS